jgi:hypothetical protein
VANEIHQNYGIVWVGWVFLYGMVRHILYTLLLSSLLLGALSLPKARAQALIDSVHSAVRPDSSFVRALGIPNGANFSFDHLLSIYEWHGRFEYGTPESPAFARIDGAGIDTVHLEGDSRFLQDNLIRSTSTIDSIYADAPLYGGSVRPMIAFCGSSYATSGLPGFSAASLVPGATDGYGVAGLRFLPLRSDLDFSAAAGVAMQAQSGISTAVGPIVRGVFYAPAEMASENTMLTAGVTVDERFFKEGDQRFSNDRASFGAVSSVGGAGTLDSNHVYLDAGLVRRDFFYNNDSNAAPIKQERTELSLSLRDSLNYPIAANALNATLNAALEPSSITRQSDIPSNELTSGGFSAVSSLLVPNEASILRMLIGGRLDLIASNQWSAQARMSYDQKTENVQLLGNELSGIDPSIVSNFANILNESSFEQRVTQAGASVQYQPSPRERFQIETNANLLNYDTPSALNDDDHDELVTSADARYDRFFSDELHAWVSLRAARTHLVYLMSDRSAQNNITQSLELSTNAVYSTSTILAQASGEVFANYTVLDFLDSIPALEGVGNYVLRGLTLSDSVVAPMSGNLSGIVGPLTAEEDATLRVTEQGSYDEPTFSEALNTRVTELSASLLLGLASTGGQAPWRVQAGARSFFLTREGINTVSLATGPQFEELERQIRVGPIVIISLMRWRGVGPMLNGSIWYSVIKDQTFDTPSLTRTPQLECQLTSQWTF